MSVILRSYLHGSTPKVVDVGTRISNAPIPAFFILSISERDFYFFVPHPALAPAARAAASICSLVRGSLLLPDFKVILELLPSNWTVRKFRCV